MWVAAIAAEAAPLPNATLAVTPIASRRVNSRPPFSRSVIASLPPWWSRSAARDKSATLRIETGPRLFELMNFGGFEQGFEHARQMRSHCFASRVVIARAQRRQDQRMFVAAWTD